MNGNTWSHQNDIKLELMPRPEGAGLEDCILNVKATKKIKYVSFLACDEQIGKLGQKDEGTGDISDCTVHISVEKGKQNFQSGSFGHSNINEVKALISNCSFNGNQTIVIQSYDGHRGKENM